MSIDEIKEKNIKDVTADEFKYLFIECNMTVKEINKLLHCNAQRYLQKFNIKKDKTAVVEKRKKTNIEKYGTANPLASDVIKDKIKQTNLEKYGVVYPMQSKSMQDKRLKTFEDKYGYKSAFSNEETRHKAKETVIEKYGVDNVSKNKDIIKKAQNSREQTNLEKYGVENQFQRQEIKDKRNSTLLETYGTSNVMDISAIKNKKMKTVYGELGKDYKNYEIVMNKDKLIEYINSLDDKTIKNIAQKLELSDSRVAQLVRQYCLYDIVDYLPHYSAYESELVEYLKDLGISNIDRNNRKILNGKEIDIYLPDYKIGIEFNGTYYHSTLFKISNDYHYKKSLECEKAGIHLIHIYEYEWISKKELVKSLLKTMLNKASNIIYARKCEVKKCSNKDVLEFVDNYHIQGHRNASVTYGLYYNNELVEMMSFSKNNKYEWEIIRGCTKDDYVVYGGVSKLFNTFIKEYNPSTIFTYCDFNKFTGKSYEKLNMQFGGYTGPDMKWVIDGEVYNRNPAKHKEMKSKAQFQIYGAGSKKYIWKSLEE